MAFWVDRKRLAQQHLNSKKGGKFTVLAAATQIKQQDANRLHSADWKTSLRLIYLDSIAGTWSSGLTVSTISGDIPVALCEKFYLNADDRVTVSSSISRSHPVSLQSPFFFSFFWLCASLCVAASAVKSKIFDEP